MTIFYSNKSNIFNKFIPFVWCFFVRHETSLNFFLLISFLVATDRGYFTDIICRQSLNGSVIPDF